MDGRMQFQLRRQTLMQGLRRIVRIPLPNAVTTIDGWVWQRSLALLLEYSSPVLAISPGRRAVVQPSGP